MQGFYKKWSFINKTSKNSNGKTLVAFVFTYYGHRQWGRRGRVQCCRWLLDIQSFRHGGGRGG